jgi:hypothetical protein
MNTQVPNIVKQQIIISEMKMWADTRDQFMYRLTLRQEAVQSANVDPSFIKPLQDEIARSEQAIEILQKELDALKAEGKTNEPPG